MSQPFVHRHSGDVDMTPWKGAKPAGAILIAIILGRACPISANLLAMNKVNKCKAEQNYKKVAHC